MDLRHGKIYDKLFLIAIFFLFLFYYSWFRFWTSSFLWYVVLVFAGISFLRKKVNVAFFIIKSFLFLVLFVLFLKTDNYVAIFMTIIFFTLFLETGFIKEDVITFFKNKFFTNKYEFLSKINSLEEKNYSLKNENDRLNRKLRKLIRELEELRKNHNSVDGIVIDEKSINDIVVGLKNKISKKNRILGMVHPDRIQGQLRRILTEEGKFQWPEEEAGMVAVIISKIFEELSKEV